MGKSNSKQDSRYNSHTSAKPTTRVHSHGVAAHDITHQTPLDSIAPGLLSVTPTPRVLPRRIHSDSVASVVYCGNPWTLASGGADTNVVVSAVNTTKTSMQLKGHTRAITQILWSTTLKHVFSCSRDKSIRMWDWMGKCCVQEFQGHTMSVAGIASFESMLVSGSRDGTLKTWNTETGASMRTAHVNRNVITSLRAITRSDGGCQEFVQASEDKMLRVWDINTLQNVLQLPRQQYIHTSCDATNEGTVLLCGSNGLDGHGCSATLWDRRMAAKSMEVLAHTHGVTDCKFLPKTSAFPEQLFVTSSLDSTVKVWGVKSADKPLVSFTLNAGGSIQGLDAIPGPGGVIK